MALCDGVQPTQSLSPRMVARSFKLFMVMRLGSMVGSDRQNVPAIDNSSH